jgi:hypothetical protein
MVIYFVNFSVGQVYERKVATADSILQVRGEVFFSFPVAHLTPEIAGNISVEAIKNSEVFAYANKQGFLSFLKLNIDFQLQPGNFLSSRLKSENLSNPDLVYPSYPRYLEILREFKNKYSNLCDLHQVGSSVNGRKLMMLKLSAPASIAKSRPPVLLASSIHGNELTGFKLLLWLSEYLLNNYGSDPLVTRLMEEAEIWIYPLANPDGTYFGGDYTVANAKRFNANNLDLNRNYPDPSAGDHPDGESWQPETVAMIGFFKQKQIVLSGVLHTGAELVNYPWDTWSRLHADNSWYRQISRNYTNLVHQKNELYMSSYENGIVNGYTWYRITGGQQDFLNYFEGGRGVTIELSEEGMPDSVTLAKYWEYNRDALLNFIEESLYGLTGLVTNAKTGLPLAAKVELVNHDKDNSWVYSSSSSGRYFRTLATGNYRVRVSKVGYKETFRQLSLFSEERRELNFALEPLSYRVLVYPNPFQGILNLEFSDALLSSDEITVSLANVPGKVFIKLKISGLSGNLVTLNLPSLPDGMYILKIESNRFTENVKLMKIE